MARREPGLDRRIDHALDMFEPERDAEEPRPGVLALLLLGGAVVALVLYHARVVTLFF
jgi:hypothetical protein